jgi:cytochrome c oxidase cbb3-type subunit I/II
VPYPDRTVADAANMARVQAEEIAAKVVAESGPAGLADRQVVALVAYLMRIGTDLDKPVQEQAPTGVATIAEPAAGGGQ